MALVGARIRPIIRVSVMHNSHAYFVHVPVGICVMFLLRAIE